MGRKRIAAARALVVPPDVCQARLCSAAAAGDLPRPTIAAYWQWRAAQRGETAERTGSTEVVGLPGPPGAEPRQS
jgi:hypothetical protein